MFERNRAEDAFGFGVVFSDETLTVFEHADPLSYRQITERLRRTGPTSTSTTAARRRARAATGSAALGRTRAAGDPAAAGGVARGRDPVLRPRRRRSIELGWADLVVGADGASSAVRAARADEFEPSLDPRYCRYMWMGTDLVFDAFKFFIAETPAGVFQAHAYPYDDRT